MYFADKLDAPGDHPIQFNGLAGRLEGVLTVPAKGKKGLVAMLGHPHSLQGGTMNNKVVTTLARAFAAMGIPSVRFNFRGVGLSQGVYDDGVGESDDLLALCQLWASECPESRYFFAGFSFGSYVTYRAALKWPALCLISVAPPVNHYVYHQDPAAPLNWVILQGDSDEVVPSAMVVEFAAGSNPPIPLHCFPNTGHFFHGKLVALKETVMQIIAEQTGG